MATPEMRKQAPTRGFPVVCIGMSSGAIEPLKALFQHLSPETGMAFVIIHHVARVPTRLPELVRHWTKMHVELAEEGATIQPDNVYILPSGKELKLAGNSFLVAQKSKVFGWPDVGTVFLDSLSNSQHPGIAVILSGMNGNGAAALKHLKEQGGFAIAQELETATSPHMPAAAIETGQVDYVLPPEKIGPKLEEISKALQGGKLV